eukprot:m.242168 g.242168  ORF g.242168 m.242168 type:complete len:203 (-) comp13977_c0_seq1:407-1015(-)
MGNIVDAVLPRLSLGSAYGTQAANVSKFGFTHIISISMEGPLEHVTGVEYLEIKIDDADGVRISDYFLEAITFIHNARLAGGHVFVQCRAGVSRSATLVLAYLLTLSPLGVDDCLTALQRARELVKPNEGFLAQLHEFAAGEPLKDLRARMANPADEAALRQLMARRPAQRASSALMSSMCSVSAAGRATPASVPPETSPAL